MYQIDHGHILDVIDSCVNGEHTTSCYGWIKDMYNKSILTFEEFCEYSEIIYEKDVIVGSENNTIPICIECA